MSSDETSEKQREWYKHGWGLIAAILLLPYFLVWYAWAKSKWPKAGKIAITVFVALLSLIAVFAEPSDVQNQQQAQQRVEQKPQLKQESAEEKERKRVEAEQKAQAEVAQATKDKNTYIEDDKYTLREGTKDNILKVLKSPSTAKFQGGVLDPYDGWSFNAPQNNMIVVGSVVDSQNSFGAMIRSSFSMTWCKADDAFKVVEYTFDGQQSPRQAECPPYQP